MKALVYLGTRTVREQNVAPPQAAAGEALVAVLRAGVCGTDVCLVRDERPRAEPPMTLGHEFVGIRLDTGERVIVNPLIACGTCRSCREARPHLCEKRQVIGVHRPGGFAETVSVPIANLVPTGAATLAQAAMADPVATALHAFRLGPVPAGPVAVLGAGAIGLSLLFVLKRLGISEVTVTELSEERRELARSGGANFVAAAAEGTYDVVYDTVGAAATRRDAAARIRAGGTAILVGLHAADLQVPAGPVIGGERTLRGSFGYTPDEFREAVAMLPDLDTRWIHDVPFSEAEGMFTALLEGRAPAGQVKLQIRFRPH